MDNRTTGRLQRSQKSASHRLDPLSITLDEGIQRHVRRIRMVRACYHVKLVNEQRETLVYYASQQMSSGEQNYTTIEREALPVVYLCMKFRHYLQGYKVVFYTDHDSLKYLVNKADLSEQIARSILLL